MYLPVSIAILIGDVKKTIKLKTKTTNVKTKTALKSSSWT